MTVNPSRRAAAPQRRSSASTQDQRAEQTRASVLDAALAIFCEQTYGGARIEQIARRAGVSPGTIYKYFPSKQALVNEVFRHWKRTTREYAFPHTRGTSVHESLHGWWEQFCRFAVEHPQALDFLLTHHHGPYLDEASLALGDPMDQLAVRVLKEGQAQGAIRSGDPELLVAMALGVYTGLVRELRARGAPLDEASLEVGWACVWDMVRAR